MSRNVNTLKALNVRMKVGTWKDNPSQLHLIVLTKKHPSFYLSIFMFTLLLLCHVFEAYVWNALRVCACWSRCPSHQSLKPRDNWSNWYRPERPCMYVQPAIICMFRCPLTMWMLYFACTFFIQNMPCTYLHVHYQHWGTLPDVFKCF